MTRKGPNRRIKRGLRRRRRREHCAARRWLPGDPATCYCPRHSRGHPGNVGLIVLAVSRFKLGSFALIAA